MNMKFWLQWFGSLIVGSFIVLGLIGLTAPHSEATPTTPTSYQVPLAEPTYPVSPEIAQLGAEVGLMVAQLEKLNISVGDVSKSGCIPGMNACYSVTTQNGVVSHTIILSNYSSGTLAYEYSHYVWDQTTPYEQSLLEPDLMALYQRLLSSPYFAAETSALFPAEGPIGSDAFYNEMYSMACSETHDYELSASLLQRCSSFLPNRNALPSHF